LGGPPAPPAVGRLGRQVGWSEAGWRYHDTIKEIG